MVRGFVLAAVVSFGLAGAAFTSPATAQPQGPCVNLCDQRQIACQNRTRSNAGMRACTRQRNVCAERCVGPRQRGTFSGSDTVR
jgi:hypothetical protein